MIRAVAHAMEQAGIRPSQGARRVGDFVLDHLMFDSPTGAYQDWAAKHAAIESTARLARIYMVARQTTEEQRKIITNAAFREFQLLERLDHPGIIKADPPTECEYGPVLFGFERPEGGRGSINSNLWNHLRHQNWCRRRGSSGERRSVWLDENMPRQIPHDPMRWLNNDLIGLAGSFIPPISGPKS